MEKTPDRSVDKIEPEFTFVEMTDAMKNDAVEAAKNAYSQHFI